MNFLYTLHFWPMFASSSFPLCPSPIMPKLPLPVPGIPLPVFFSVWVLCLQVCLYTTRMPSLFLYRLCSAPPGIPHYNDLSLLSWCLHKWQNQGPCLKRALKVSLGIKNKQAWRVARHTHLHCVLTSTRFRTPHSVPDLWIWDKGFISPKPSDLFLKLLGLRRTQALGTYELGVWFGTS